MKKIYKLEPSLHANIWGGGKLRQYGKESSEDRIGESWELSFVKGAEASVGGIALSEKFSKEAWGSRASNFEEFPSLTKFIDAREKLSVQVHPDDEYAGLHEGGYGKSEMWYVVSAEENAGLYMGFKHQTDKKNIERAVKDGTVEELLSFKKVKSGDVFFIPAGTVHAIGAGVLIFEIQQNSTSTYRLYDYMRKDKNGNLRELHLEKALDVLNSDVYTPFAQKNTENEGGKTIGCCKYFTVKEYNLTDTKEKITVTEESFLSITCVSGNGVILYTDNGAEEKISFKAGDSFFIPASKKPLEVSLDGSATVLTVSI